MSTENCKCCGQSLPSDGRTLEVATPVAETIEVATHYHRNSGVLYRMDRPGGRWQFLDRGVWTDSCINKSGALNNLIPLERAQ